MKKLVAHRVGDTPDVQEGVVTKYLDSLKARKLRYWTVYNRQRALARLRAWAGGEILYLREDQLRAWQLQRSTEIQAEPLRTDMSHHRQFYRWCLREGFRSDDPTAHLDLPRVARRVPRPIRDGRLADAVACADPAMHAILALAAFAGLRACEIAALDWSEVDLDGERPRLFVSEGKGGHARQVPVSGPLATALAALPRPHRGPLIRRLDGRPGPNRAHRISSRANDYLHELGIEETLHQCRHRFGTSTYQACRDIRAVQEMMGHMSPTTTAIYAAASSDVARAAVEAAGVLAVPAHHDGG